MVQKKVAIAGHVCRDSVKIIHGYPQLGQLAKITEITQSVGGAVPNTSISLARMGPEIRVCAYTRVGDDDGGAFIRQIMEENGVDTRGFVIDPRPCTSFTDVMHDRKTGERTFFHYAGCNAFFSPADIDLAHMDCDVLHIAYLTLLDAFAEQDPEFGTVMARFLQQTQARGILTSIDVASAAPEEFAQVLFSLPYCDYAFMNEAEGAMISGIPSRNAEGTLLPENIGQTLRFCRNKGVRRRVILHCPEAGFCLDEEDRITMVPSLALPEGYIQGSVGAGDAFCAGCLRRICLGGTPKEMLEYASAASAANLSKPDSIGGMRCEREILALMERFPRRTDLGEGRRE